MTAPHRLGIEQDEWEHLRTPLLRSRAQALRHAEDRTNLGGTACLWRRREDGALRATQLLIQPGMADDLPSFLSALALELNWPGAALEQTTDPQAPLAFWAGIWQLREQADLYIQGCWDRNGLFHAEATLQPVDGAADTILETDALTAALTQHATAPVASRSPHGLLLAANTEMQAGNYTQARALYADARQDLPTHSEAHRNLALALARLNEWASAAEMMRRALELNPHDAQLAQEYLALETDAGVRAMQQGDGECAAVHFLRILEHWPDEPTALANLGNIRLRDGRLPEARAIFRRLLRRHPEHPIADQIRQVLKKMDEG